MCKICGLLLFLAALLVLAISVAVQRLGSLCYFCSRVRIFSGGKAMLGLGFRVGSVQFDV